MFHTAVIFTDLTPASDSVVRRAEALLEIGVREVVLAHILDITQTRKAPSREQNARFEQQASYLETLGLRLRVDTELGRPAGAMAAVAERHRAALVVVGCSSSEDGEGVRDAFASLAAELGRPLLVTPAGPPRDGEPLLGSVLYPTDLSQRSRSVLRALRDIASRGAERVTLLHVSDVKRVGHQAVTPARQRHDATNVLAEMGAALRGSGARDVDAQYVVGDPPKEVGERVAEGDYTLVVMGTGVDRRDPDAPPGDVQTAVTQACAVPVLLVPPTPA